MKKMSEDLGFYTFGGGGGGPLSSSTCVPYKGLQCDQSQRLRSNYLDIQP